MLRWWKGAWSLGPYPSGWNSVWMLSDLAKFESEGRNS